MAADPSADELRDMAAHRGFKLLRSRKRKEGSGDFGKFGLADASGQSLIGVSDEGLTASAQEIEAYLRGGALGTWRKSAASAPRRRVAKNRKFPDPPAPRPPRASEIPQAAPPPERELIIRAGNVGDIPRIAALLGVPTDIDELTMRMANLRKTGGAVAIAELGGMVGCCAWTVIPTLQHGPVGRVTLLFIDKDHRRRGIGTKLVAVAQTALAKKGCALLEILSDIEISNAHGFFRTLGFAQMSYRFTRPIKDGEG